MIEIGGDLICQKLLLPFRGKDLLEQCTGLKQGSANVLNPPALIMTFDNLRSTGRISSMGKAPKQLPLEVLKAMQSSLHGLDKQFPIVSETQWGQLVNYATKSDFPVHRWFRNREGYSVQLVESVLESVSKTGFVVDPFCGTGTTLLTAAMHDYPSIGIDVNPLSVFITKVKTRHYDDLTLRRIIDICDGLTALHPSMPASEKPKLNIIDQVFLPDILHALLVAKYYINQHSHFERDFLFVAWLSILEEVSNVYREGNGIKYRNRKRTPSGYIQIPLDLWQQEVFPSDKFGYVIQTLIKRAQMMLRDIAQIKLSDQSPDVQEGSALALDEFVPANSANLVIFSPPYANNFNYFKAYKIELWMGDFVDGYDELRELTQRSLRSHVETKLEASSDKYNWYPEQLDTFLGLMDPEVLWTPRILKSIQGYFYDMQTALNKIFDVLKQDGQCVIVVGNSAYSSVIVPTDTLLAEAAASIGFNVEKIAVARHLTTSSQQKEALAPVNEYLRESLIFLKKKRTEKKRSSYGNGQVHLRYVSELPKQPKPPTQTIYVIRNNGLTDVTHIIHKFPGKFIPHVPRWAIKKYINTDRCHNILDPFCGSGTTLVEAQLTHQNAYGIDINPIARLISKVKTTPLPMERLNYVVNCVIEEVLEETKGYFRPTISTLTHWFRPDVTDDLSVIRDAINKWSNEQDIYDFLIVAFSAIIRKVSNADNQSIKTYVSGTHKKVIPQVKPLFIDTLRKYAERIQELGAETKHGGIAKVVDLRDARQFAQHWNEQELPLIDLAITSPPYVKTVDYVYSQMVEYFWIGDLFNLENQGKLNEHKRVYIGTEKVLASEYRTRKITDIPEIDSLIEQIHERSPKHAHIVYSYFADMRDHFGQMYEIMKPNAPYIVVVGDSTVSDLPVETHHLLALCAAQTGFRLEETFAYEIRNRYMRFPRQGRGGIVDLDWILAFRKT